MSPRKNVSEERRHQILDAAEHVFSDKGFDQARMDDIASRTGLSKGTLYLYYPSKESIITAILDRIFQGEFREMEKVPSAETSATARLRQFTEMASRDVTIMLRLMPIAYEFLALAFRNRLVQETLRKYFRRYMDILVPIIQDGIDAGEFRPVDATEVALAAGAIFEGTILLWVYDKEMVDPLRHIHSGIELLIMGIQAQG